MTFAPLLSLYAKLSELVRLAAVFAAKQARGLYDRVVQFDYRHFLRRNWIRFRNIYRHDQTAILCCFLLSVAICIYVQTREFTDAEFTIPVVRDVESDTADTIISSLEPATVKIRISCPKGDLAAFRQEQDMKVLVSASPKGTNTTQTVDLKRTMVRGRPEKFPFKKFIDTKKITVTFDAPKTKSYTINPPVFVNEPLLENYEKAFRMSTNQVSVSGPSSVLGKISDAIKFDTKPIDLAGRTGSFSTALPILNLPTLEGAKWDRKEIVVEVDLSDKTVSTNFEGIALLLAARSGDGSRYVSNPETVTIHVSGGKTAVESVTPENLIAICNADGIGPEGAERQVHGSVIGSFKGLHVHTEPAMVFVSIKPDDPADAKPAEATAPENANTPTPPDAPSESEGTAPEPEAAPVPEVETPPVDDVAAGGSATEAEPPPPGPTP